MKILGLFTSSNRSLCCFSSTCILSLWFVLAWDRSNNNGDQRCLPMVCVRIRKLDNAFKTIHIFCGRPNHGWLGCLNRAVVLQLENLGEYLDRRGMSRSTFTEWHTSSWANQKFWPVSLDWYDNCYVIWISYLDTKTTATWQVSVAQWVGALASGIRVGRNMLFTVCLLTKYLVHRVYK